MKKILTIELIVLVLIGLTFGLLFVMRMAVERDRAMLSKIKEIHKFDYWFDRASNLCADGMSDYKVYTDHLEATCAVPEGQLYDTNN
jgi:hypothetical protein